MNNSFSSLFRRVALGAAMAGAAGLAGAQSLQITTVAGYPGQGSADGAGGAALFYNPQGVAVDASGTLYVADTGNNVVRKVTAAGVSSTLAGRSGVAGSADGAGTNAFFNQPCGIAVDAAGNVYVSDYGSSTIRKITSGGVVTTIAGSANVTGSVNNTGTNALFFHPMGLAVDAATNVYVADYGNHLIRQIAPGNVVSTLAGQAGVFGSGNGTGTGAQFYEPEAVAVDASGIVYVADTGNAAIRKIASGGVVTTLAGSPGSLGSTDGVGTNALFYQPAGLAVGSSGIIYVSDYFNNTVRQVTASGGIVTTLSGLAGTTGSSDGATSSARFWAPQGVAVNNAAGLIYVADSANGAIRAVTTAGVVTTLAGSPSAAEVDGSISAARFYAPQNVAIDNANNVYVADTQNSVIRKISPYGVVSVLAGSPGVFGSADGTGGNALFNAPQGLAVDGSGNLYVADTGNSTIRLVSSGGVVSTLAGKAGNPGVYDGTGVNAQFNQPEGIAVDASGNLYVADTWNHTIREITSGNVVTTLAGQAGVFGTFDGANAQARFNNPTGVAVDSTGNIFVSDFNNDTIREITPAGVVSTLAGWPGIWGSADGTGTNALFNGPAGLALDPSGNLYVIDSGNQTVRKLTPSGTNWTSSTVAGNGAPGSLNGTGSAAQFYYPAGVAVSSAGYVYVADSGNNAIRSQAIPPSILTQPQSQTIPGGTTTQLNVAAYGSTPFTYIWQYNGANYLTNTSSSITASNAGSYSVQVSNLAGQTNSAIATLTLTNYIGGAGVFQTISRLSNGVVQFNLTGTSGANYTLDVSTNLPYWTHLASFSMTNGAVQIIDTAATNIPARFYRLVSP